MSILQFSIKQSRSSARVVDGKLILSFPDALTPVLWQMDLGEAKASALEVLPGEGASHILTLRTARGESLDIAPFATREEAVQGLMAVSRALENAHGQIRPGSSNGPGIRINAPKLKTGGAKNWGVAVLGLLFAFALFSMWASLAPRPPSGINSGAPGAASAPPSNAGVPLSADDYLKGM
jgi:hypothetical protein